VSVPSGSSKHELVGLAVIGADVTGDEDGPTGAEVGVRVHSPQLKGQSVPAFVLLSGAQLVGTDSGFSSSQLQVSRVETPSIMTKKTPPDVSLQASVGAGVVGGSVGVPVVGCCVGSGVGGDVVGLGVGAGVGFEVGLALGLVEGLLVIQRSGPTALKKQICSSIHFAYVAILVKTNAGSSDPQPTPGGAPIPTRRSSLDVAPLITRGPPKSPTPHGPPAPLLLTPAQN
jgi:hypothetical protein